MSFSSRYEKKDRLAFVVFAIPIVILLLWHLSSSHGPARLLLNCYVLIATPFFVLIGSYPPFGSRWFWKAMIPIAAIVAVAVYVQMQVTEWFRYIDVALPARMAFGFTSAFAVVEALAALQIVDATESKSSF